MESLAQAMARTTHLAVDNIEDVIIALPLQHQYARCKSVNSHRESAFQGGFLHLVGIAAYLVAIAVIKHNTNKTLVDDALTRTARKCFIV